MLKKNRSLDRGLIVLETLAQHSALSLSDIHRATGLPKSTLRRLLATLVNRRFVHRSISDKLYRIAITLPDISVQSVPSGLAIVADISMKHALDLTKRIAWPSDIHLLDEHSLRIVDTTRSASPFSLYDVPLDLRVSLFGSATGTACISQMEESEVRRLFDNKNVGPMLRPSRFGLTWESLQAHLEKVRTQGYGERLPNFIGESIADDKLSAIALPTHRGDQICGAITILWPRSFMSVEEFANRFLEDLKSTVAQIELDLDAFDKRQRKQSTTKPD